MYKGSSGLGRKRMKILNKQTETELNYIDFDPNKQKLRKGGKIGNASFKSKSKFKRR